MKKKLILLREISVSATIATLLGTVATIAYDGWDNSSVWIFAVILFMTMNISLRYIINELIKLERRKKLKRRKKMCIRPSIIEDEI